MADKVNPIHYQKDKFEVIDVIATLCDEIEDTFVEQKPLVGYCLGNSIKYLLRCCTKGDMLTDLKKCAWYLNRAINLIEKTQS